jgi:Na+/H+ antiporter NhaD/arsenite permease-like protein
MVVTQTIGQHHAVDAIDFNTLGLLTGMMLIVRLTETTGVYTYLAIRAGQLARGEPLRVVVALTGTTALLSAFLDNLTTVLLVVPITFLLADTPDIATSPCPSTRTPSVSLSDSTIRISSSPRSSCTIPS